jgi:hypothetical protein
MAAMALPNSVPSDLCPAEDSPVLTSRDLGTHINATLQNFADGGHQFTPGREFQHETGRPGPNEVRGELCIMVRGEKDEGHAASVHPELVEGLPATLSRHRDIGHDHVRLELARSGDQGLAVADDGHDLDFLVEEADQTLNHRLVVIRE